MSNFKKTAKNHEDIIDIFNSNKDKNWYEWLEFDKIFSKPGKQGLAGLFNIKGTNKQIVFKISQYINHLSQHEYSIMKGLSAITDFCPHICKGIGVINCNIDPKSRKSGNPFKPICKYPIEKEVLLSEFIDNSKKFYNYISSEKIPEDGRQDSEGAAARRSSRHGQDAPRQGSRRRGGRAVFQHLGFGLRGDVCGCRREPRARHVRARPQERALHYFHR